MLTAWAFDSGCLNSWQSKRLLVELCFGNATVLGNFRSGRHDRAARFAQSRLGRSSHPRSGPKRTTAPARIVNNQQFPR